MASIALKRPSVVQTGSPDGIGVTTAKNLVAKKGYNVNVHGRDEDRMACQTVRNFMQDWTEGDGISVYSVKAGLSTRLMGPKVWQLKRKCCVKSTNRSEQERTRH